MKRFIAYITILAAASAMFSCKNFDDMNENPYAIYDTTAESFVQPILYNAEYTMSYANYYLISPIMQNTVSTNYETSAQLTYNYVIAERTVAYLWQLYNQFGNAQYMLDAARKEKKGVIVFSPLAQGLLTDRYLDGIPDDSRIRTSGIFLKETVLTDEMRAKLRALNDIARERGETLAQMALAWVLRRDEVTSVLIGASKPAQILDNLGALTAAPFSDEELARIDEIVL